MTSHGLLLESTSWRSSYQCTLETRDLEVLDSCVGQLDHSPVWAPLHHFDYRTTVPFYRLKCQNLATLVIGLWEDHPLEFGFGSGTIDRYWMKVHLLSSDKLVHAWWAKYFTIYVSLSLTWAPRSYCRPTQRCSTSVENRVGWQLNDSRSYWALKRMYTVI